MIYKSKHQFGAYLAGLWEGDGHIRVTKSNLPKPSILITFHSNQHTMAEALLGVLTKQCDKGKIGSIYRHSKRNACYLCIYSEHGLRHFVDLVNGKLRTPKAYQIGIVVRMLNKKYSLNIKHDPINKKSILNDAWWTGFMEADGSFAIRNTIKTDVSKKKCTECYMVLVQRASYSKTGESYEPVLTLIAKAFNVNLNYVIAKTGRGSNQYKIKISSSRSKKILRSYLEKFPLLTSKYLDYKTWCQADDIMISKMHYTAAGSLQIHNLKQTMNTYRTNFDTSHVEVFYKTCV